MRPSQYLFFKAPSVCLCHITANEGAVGMFTDAFFEILFQPSHVFASPEALDLLKRGGIEPAELLDRHVSGDFGEAGQMRRIVRRMMTAMSILMTWHRTVWPW
jgi:hypothetical protein